VAGQIVKSGCTDCRAPDLDGVVKTPRRDIRAVGRVCDRVNTIGVTGQVVEGRSTDCRVPDLDGVVITSLCGERAVGRTRPS